MPRHPQREAEEYGGLAIRGILPGTPAHLAGLRSGDVLLRVNGQDTPDLESFYRAKESCGDRLDLLVVRAGQLIEKTVHLDTGARPTLREAAAHVVRARVFEPTPPPPSPKRGRPPH